LRRHLLYAIFRIGEKLEFSASSKELLFYPETVELTILGGEYAEMSTLC
jgi:hypothetical protein